MKVTPKLLTPKSLLFAFFEKDEKRMGSGRELFRVGYNTDTDRNIKQWKRIEDADICAEVSTKKQLDTKGF